MDQPSQSIRAVQVLIVGLISVVIVLGIALIVLVIRQAETRVNHSQVDVLAASTDECVTCHREDTPGIVEQFSQSAMAAAEVTCCKCHEVGASYSGAVEREGAYILASPTTSRCAQCH